MGLIIARKMHFHNDLVHVIKIVQRECSKSYPLATLDINFNDNIPALQTSFIDHTFKGLISVIPVLRYLCDARLIKNIKVI